MRIFGVIGYPIGHSLSPVMHTAAFQALGLDALYTAFAVPPRVLRPVLQALEVCAADGLNITVPHKEATAVYLSRRGTLTPTARAIGAVNTLVLERGRYVGHNTDVEGFRQVLRRELTYEIRGKRVLLLGAGGAARAVAWALASDHATQLVIANRTRTRAESLARWIRAAFSTLTVRTIPLKDRDVAEVLQETDLLINATSLGLRANDPLPVRLSSVPRRVVLVDLVYRAPTTRVVQDARKRGMVAIDGLSMLVYQGAEAIRLWTQQDPPVPVMRRAVEQAIRKSRPRSIGR